MYQANKNKEFVIEYLNALSGVTKIPEILDRFVADDELRDHIIFFDAVLPKYELIADELIAEGDRVVVKAHVKGRHEGEFKGIPPTHKQVEFGAVVCYTVQNEKIVNHWMIVDMATMMEQLGVSDFQTA